MRRVLVVFVALLALSCSRGGAHIGFGPTVTSSQRESTAWAIWKWSGVLAAPMSVDGGSHPDFVIVLAPPRGPRCRNAGDCIAYTHGDDDPVASLRHVIQVDPAIRDEDFAPVIEHELGHVNDLRHTHAGVMMPGSNALDFSPEDIEECRRVGACW